jgi:integrase
VSRNVARLTNPPRVQRKEVVPLSPEAARRLLSAAKEDRLHALYAVALAIGLRKGEVSALRWSDVDLEAGTLRVSGTMKRMTGQGLLRDEPKTSRSRRTVPLPDVCVDALRAHRLAQAQERLAQGSRWHDLGYVFTTTLGTPLDPRNLTRQFQAAASAQASHPPGSTTFGTRVRRSCSLRACSPES